MSIQPAATGSKIGELTAPLHAFVKLVLLLYRANPVVNCRFFAFSRLASLKSAPATPAREKSVSQKLELMRLVLVRSVSLRSAAVKIAKDRLPPDKSPLGESSYILNEMAH